MAPVRISQLRLFRYHLPFRSPFTLKDKEYAKREGVLLQLFGSEGQVGWGEIAPLPGFSEESLDQATQELLALRSACIGSWFDPGELLPKKIVRRTLLPSVQCGLEMGMLNLGAACRGITVGRLLEPGSSSAVAVNALLMGSGDDLVAQVRTRVAEGFRTLKLKVGRQSVKDDIAAVRRVRETIGEKIELRLDANRAWSLEDAALFAEGIRECHIAYVEEPLADPADLPVLCHNTELPVALDETMTVLNPGGVPLFPGLRAIILKPMLLGGLGRCRQFAREALDDGILPVISSSIESGVGIAVLANLAAATMPKQSACGLDTLSLFERDSMGRSPSIHDGTFDLEQIRSCVGSVDQTLLEETPGA